MGESGEFIIKARGLPWSTTVKDMVSFFHDCNVVGGEAGIHLTLDKEGRASGDCFVELASEDDLDKAKAHNKEHIGSRYVEIHDAKRAEMEWQMNRMSGTNQMPGGDTNDGFVKLRGLPYEVTKDDIAKFFSGLEIAPYGITITMGQDGRPSGEAYVEFKSVEEVEKAIQKNKEKIGHRYIEIFNSSKHDVKYVSQPSNSYGGGNFPPRAMGGGRPSPYARPGGNYGGSGGMNTLGPSGFNTGGMVTGRNPRGGRGGRGGGRGGRNMGETQAESQPSTTGHMVHMRGLPFTATQGDVFSFFAPLNPVEVRILYEEAGRPKGECDVDFSTHADAESAMAKDKQNMGHRYIELFLRSENSNNSWSNNAPMLSQLNNANPSAMMNSAGQANMQSGYGGSYGGGYGGGGGGSGDYGGSMGGGGATGGNYNSYSNNGYGAVGASSGYSSFNENTNYSSMPQSTGGNYY